jgi:DNA polymerase-3 subunit beta
MNFSVSKNELFNALAITNHAVSSNSPLPALRGIRIDAKDNALTLTGSDSDISIQKIMKADDQNKLTITEEGSILIEAKYLLDIVKKIDSDIITVEILDGSLTRFSGSSAEFKLNGMNVNDYPTIDFSRPANELHLNAGVLSAIIDETAFAASLKETRPVLTGVNFKLENGSLCCTATDSYRLAKKTLTIPSEASFSITIPAKSLNEVKGTMLADASKDLIMAESDKKVQFVSDEMLLQTRLLDGGYPETDRLIPTDFKYTLKMNRRDLISAIDRNTFIKNDNLTINRLQCSASEVILTNKSQEIGESRESLAAQFEGEDLDISFSGTYVMDAAKSLTGDQITIKFKGEMNPFILINEEDDSILQLVLPVRTYN